MPYHMEPLTDQFHCTQAMPASQHHQSPPYAPTTAALGGSPTVKVDVPICAIFMVLYILGAVAHMAIFKTNMKRGHKFIMSGMIFGFCMARIMTTMLRIVWATRPTNIRIAIAANIFVAAGVVLLFIVNLIFAQRILRAQHPHAGWGPFAHFGFIALYVLIVITLAMVIIGNIQSFYTLNLNTRRIDRDLILYGGTFYTVISFLPIPIALASLAFPRKQRTEKFGQGRFRNKIIILLAASTLLCLGAAFRVGINYAGGKRPRNHPAHYQDKACFYIFNFVVEILVIYLYIVVRVDKRFHVPNGSHGPGDYSRTAKLANSEEALAEEDARGSGKLEKNIATEEETFDDMTAAEVAASQNSHDHDHQSQSHSDLESGVKQPVSSADGNANAVEDENEKMVAVPAAAHHTTPGS